MLAAQHAPIGAKICTTRAIRTIGRKFFSRLRIANPSESQLITRSPKSRSGSRLILQAVAQITRHAGVSEPQFARRIFALPYPLPSGGF